MEINLACFEENSLQNQNLKDPAQSLITSFQAMADLVPMEMSGNISADNLFQAIRIISGPSFSRPSIKYKH